MDRHDAHWYRRGHQDASTVQVRPRWLLCWLQGSQSLCDFSIPAICNADLVYHVPLPSSCRPFLLFSFQSVFHRSNDSNVLSDPRCRRVLLITQATSAGVKMTEANNLLEKRIKKNPALDYNQTIEVRLFIPSLTVRITSTTPTPLATTCPPIPSLCSHRIHRVGGHQRVEPSRVHGLQANRDRGTTPLQ